MLDADAKKEIYNEWYRAGFAGTLGADARTQAEYDAASPYQKRYYQKGDDDKWYKQYDPSELAADKALPIYLRSVV